MAEQKFQFDREDRLERPKHHLHVRLNSRYGGYLYLGVASIVFRDPLSTRSIENWEHGN